MGKIKSKCKFISKTNEHNRIVRSNLIDLQGFQFHQTVTGPFETLIFEHIHSEHAVFAVLQGGTQRSSGATEGDTTREVPDRTGAVSFVPATRRHRSVLENGNFVSAYLEIDPLLVEAACDRPMEQWRPAFNLNRKRLFAEMEWLCRLALVQHEVPRATLEGMRLSMARSVARTFGGFRGRADDANLHPSALRRVLEMMEQPTASTLSLEAMARDSGLSVSAFGRAFRGSMGMTPGQYIQKIRMARARAMLRSSDISSSAIAAHLGFVDAAHFSNAFRRVHGCSPGQFRTDRASPGVQLTDNERVCV